MKKGWLIAVGLLISLPAAAQQVDPNEALKQIQVQREAKGSPPQQAPPQQPESSAAMRGLALALQSVAVAAEQYVTDVSQKLAAKDQTITELRKLCGEPCAKPEPK